MVQRETKLRGKYLVWKEIEKANNSFRKKLNVV